MKDPKSAALPGMINRRIAVYLAGVALGCIILMLFPWQDRHERWAARLPDPSPPGHYPLIWRDGHGLEIALNRMPIRLVSLAPSITEIIYALGLESRLVANTRFCLYPEGAADKPRIGGLSDPNHELLLQHRPDLIIGTTMTPKPVYDRLRSLKLRTAAFAHSDLDGVLDDIRNIGRLVGEPGAAFALIKSMDTRRQSVLQQVKELDLDAPKPVVLLYDLDALFSAGKGSWVSDLITATGGRNIADTAGSPWPKLSIEGILKADPELLILAVPFRGAQLVRAHRKLEALTGNPVWRTVRAIQLNAVYAMNKDILAIPGPRSIDALEAFAAALHPGAFSSHSGVIGITNAQATN